MNSFNDNQKKQIANLLAIILQMELPYHVKKRIFNDMLWCATADLKKQDDYKHKVPIWSENAIGFYNKNGKKDYKGLRHEHLIPKKFLREHILDNQNKLSSEEIYTLLFRFGHAAIITKEEDDDLNKKLSSKIPDGINFPPENENYLDVLFSRYKQLNINLKYVTINKKVISVHNYYYLNRGKVNKKFINNHLSGLLKESE